MSIVERALKKAQKYSQSASSDERDSTLLTPESGDTVAREVPSTAVTEFEGGSVSNANLTVDFDYRRLQEEGRLPPASSAQQVEEEIRRIKWPLLKAASAVGAESAPRNNVILVTSALPGEGKSFISLSLALSIVRDREQRVVLVDGDVAKPGLTPALRMDGQVGLNDVLDDPKLEIGAAVYRTSVNGLFFVPAGKWSEHSPEFFAGSRMQQVIDQLIARVGGGVVIVDSPPLLATNEAQAVTRYVGQVLMVVRADKTEQRAVLDALSLVDRSTPVSCILNFVQRSVVSRYYGQYYYRQGYGNPDKGEARDMDREG